MKRWTPIVYGLIAGAVLGVVLLFQKPESVPLFLNDDLMAITGFLRRCLLPGDDPMASFVFVIPVMILYCAILGALVGSVFSLILITVNLVKNH